MVASETNAGAARGHLERFSSGTFLRLDGRVEADEE
jgi:hypothetical protein